MDGATGVYLLLIDGLLETLAPSTAIQDGFRLVKLGRTMDLERRIAELSSDLPPSSLIRYIPLGMRMFPNGGEAHRFERRLLDVCDAEGWSLGGEFAYAPLDQIRSALANERP
ncbi:GIY-YIG nuclease family protein [Amaricoccus sp.]|uniref:GIY-YIG nuclease family protein n=1 Tax=Amaricoccus sp. TaxID=1872485 RepID=UPI002BA2083C|nr:GIY-YIG nuclease family protein [Amaricoccus sp.]HMQ92619.1 GIY-YIG nuclease family protein [Amaricoccus sp.]